MIGWQTLQRRETTVSLSGGWCQTVNLPSGHRKVIAVKACSNPEPWAQVLHVCFRCKHLCNPLPTALQCSQAMQMDNSRVSCASGFRLVVALNTTCGALPLVLVGSILPSGCCQIRYITQSKSCRCRQTDRQPQCTPWCCPANRTAAQVSLHPWAGSA